jgi:hypothetical protein
MNRFETPLIVHKWLPMPDPEATSPNASPFRFVNH